MHATRDGAFPAAEIAAIREHSRVPVVLVASGGQAAAMLEQALDNDVSDVLLLPQLTHNVVFSIRKAAHVRRQVQTASGQSGRVVTVFSPKGGTGKTVVAVNLAAALAKREGKRTLLLDLDLQFGDAAIALGIEPEKTIYDLVVAPGELDPEKLAGYVTKHPCGLDLLPAPLRPEDAELVVEGKVTSLLEVVRAAYDVIVVDTSPFFHGPMLATLDRSDELLVICGLDVPTLKNVRLALQTLELLSFPTSRIRYVMNRANTNVGLKTREVEEALKVKICERASVRPARPAQRQPRQPRGARRAALGLLAGDRRAREGDRGAGANVAGAGEERASPAAGEELRWDSTTASPGTGDSGVAARGAARRRSPPDPYADLKAKVHHACIAKLGPELFKQDPADLSDRVYRAASEELALAGTPLTREERRELVRQLTDDILGYGPLERLLADDSVTEVMVNGYDHVYVERAGKLERTEARFVDDAHVMRIIDKIVSQIGRRIDESSPMVDARLPDGSRVNAIVPPLALNGPDADDPEVLARPVHDQRPDLVRHAVAARRRSSSNACVKGKLNVLISGGTGTGKTTMLNAISARIPVATSGS